MWSCDGGTTYLDTADGEVRITSQPVRQDNAQGTTEGALLVVSYLDEDRAELRSTMRTYTIVAALLALLVTVVAAWQSGRLLAPLTRLRQATGAVNATDLSARLPESGNDDISALTRNFNDMLARLEQAFSDQRQFLDDAGHELRTPLTIIGGHLELLDESDPAEVEQTRRLALDEVDRMSRLVGDLILLAKHDRPDFLTLEEVDVDTLTEDILAKASALAERDWHLDAATPGTWRLDPQRVTQAMLQLCDNAAGHTAPGDRIAVGSATVDGTLRLWVRDTGPGVPAEDRDRIFERFARSAETRLGRPAGARSRPRHRLRDRHRPRRHRGRRGRDTLRRPLHDHPARTHRRRGMARILIVEDEDRIAAFLAKGLSADGHQVSTVADGLEGLEEALSGAFDLMVLDIGLPTIDGFEVLDQLRAQGSRMPVVVLTARDSVHDTVSALEGGADDYLAKPFRFAELRARINVRLRQQDNTDAEVGELRSGSVGLDLRTRRLRVDGRESDLSAREFALAEVLLRHPGQVLSRAQLLDLAWGMDFDPGSNVVDVYVGYLRKKLGSARVETVRGMGYRFQP